MTGKPSRPVAMSLLWAVLGVVALLVVTAFISVGAASLRTADRTTTLLVQLQEANSQIDSLRGDYSAAQDAQLRLEQQNERLIRVNRQQREQLRALLAYLREHGIAVPAAETDPPRLPKGSATPSGASPIQHPKPKPHPSPSAPAGPTDTPTPAPPPPTATPSPSSPPTLCVVLPLICP